MFDRLFGSRGPGPDAAERTPPGQYLTEKFPVLHYGSVPTVDLGDVGLPRLRARSTPRSP